MQQLHRFVIKESGPLAGEVEINGAKNAILPILAASILSEEQCVFKSVPLLEDVFVMCEVLRSCGVKVIQEGSTLIVDPSGLDKSMPPEILMKKMRASNLVLGPLLSRMGEVVLPFPGGCAIGSRPMNYHLQALSRLGVSIADKGAFIEAKSARLKGSDICLDFPSVGATENVMMAAARAEGVTTIQNAAREPEVVDLARFLAKMGARISGAGTDTLIIEGVKKLFGTEYQVIKDRIEAGTMMVASAITGGDIILTNYNGRDVGAVSAKLRECGVRIEYDARGLRVRSSHRLRASDIRTMPFPGFPTDMQPQFMALMSVTKGTSIISESIFENRFRHADEMRRMGADIKIIGDAAVIKGKDKLSGAEVEATDLRAGAALVLLGLVAEGETLVDNVHFIDRGYQNLELSLRSLGADIRREDYTPKEKILLSNKLCPC